MKKLFAIAILASFTAVAAPLKWTCDWPEAKSQTFSLYQGETATFEPTFRVNGQLVTNATIEAVWYQTNGMDNAWWRLDNATFAPTNDVGAASYRFFVEARGAGAKIYRANGTLRMLPSPGFVPNEIAAPVQRLDFTSIQVSNAPWALTNDVETIGAGLGSLSVSVATNATDIATLKDTTSTLEGYFNEYGEANKAVEADGAGWANDSGSALDPAPGGIIDTRLTDLETATNNLTTAVSNALTAAKDYTDEQCGGVEDQLSTAIGTMTLRVNNAASAATNYTDAATNALSPVARSGSYTDLSNKPVIPTVPTAQINAATATNALQDAAINQTRQIVATWENFLDGSNVVFSITNYISGTYNLDAAKLRILELKNGEYQEVYNSRDEILVHLEHFETNTFRTATNQVIGAVNSAIGNKADRDWGKYTSAGGEAPSNTVYMTAPNTVFAGGLEYERVAVGQGAVCILTTKGAPVWTQGDEGMFKFQDDGGTNYFGFAKTDSYAIGANTDGITVQGGVVTLTYNITMSGRPCVWYRSSLSSGTWEQLNLSDGSAVSGASHAVSWEANPPANSQVCYINVGNQPSGFFRTTVEVPGDAKFMTNMPADLSGGIMCTNTATGAMGVIKPSFNGSSVSWTWSAK